MKAIPAKPDMFVDFPARCMSAVELLCDRSGYKRPSWQRIVGTTEVYFKSQIVNIELYVYADECQIQGQGMDLRFEPCDYIDGSLMIDAFLRDLKNVCDKATGYTA